MRGFFGSFVKDSLLLWRDKKALVMLFGMPVAMVLVISMLFERALEIGGDSPARIVFVDEDGGSLGGLVRKGLKDAGFPGILTDIGGRKADEERLKTAILRGEIQAGVLIPRGATSAAKEQARRAVAAALSLPEEGAGSIPAPPAIRLYFDPAVQGSGRIFLESALNKIVLDIELKEKMAALSDLLPARINRTIHETMGDSSAKDFLSGTRILPAAWADEPLMGVEERLAYASDLEKKPTSSQHSVPAWTLFGMFFIVIPLAGSLVLERTTGTILRHLASPASFLTLLSGKALVFVLVCMIQFGLILGCGKGILPSLGVSPLDIGSSPWSMVAIALCASFAAVGFGILIGAATQSFEQAAAIGAVSVVIAATLGGIMVPIFLMPRLLQKISAFSPMGWGLRAFQDVFLRGGDARMAWPWMAYLLAFAAVCTLIGWILLHNHRRFGTSAAA